MKVAFYTLGCKVNQYETQSLREKFESLGHTPVSDAEDFDCIIINSCTVTAESDRKTRQQLNHYRRLHPNAVIVLTGCMVQAMEKSYDILSSADIITGNTHIEKIPTLVEEFLQSKEQITCINPHTKEEIFNTPKISSFAERTRAFMKIEDGCERYCTYCIIPYARGFVRSKPVEEIHKEAENLAKNGYSEIVLVGINLSAYGKNEDINLCDAVDAVCQIEGIKRVRLGSLEPDHISDEMLMRLKNQKKFCPQFHLSLQSGCDQTLKRMNRHYDTAFYRDLVKRIRNNFPDAAISTDIMVGFPGESDQEFNESLEFLKEIGFSKTHIFAYSRRKGTIADKMPEQITKSVKSSRSKKMFAVAKRSEEEFLNSLLGKTVSVLFETEENKTFFGYTPNYARVAVKSKENLTGSIKNVKISSVEGDFCYGELI